VTLLQQDHADDLRIFQIVGAADVREVVPEFRTSLVRGSSRSRQRYLDREPQREPRDGAVLVFYGD
jgi:hypothetical protein